MLLVSMTAVENGVNFMKIQRHLEQTSSGMDSDDRWRCFIRNKNQVNADIEKWTDINRVVRILGKLLYGAKITNFGPKNDRLTDQVRENIVKSFRIALMKNKGDAERMQLAITSIVPNAFGEHDSCGKWCKFHEDPATSGANIFREEKSSKRWFKSIFNTIHPSFLYKWICEKAG